MSATATKSVTFISNDPYYRAVRKPEREVFENGMRQTLEGETATFSNGMYVTDDAVWIEWLRNHPDLNFKFYEQGNEPDRQRPFSEDVIAAVTTAAIDGDVETIQALRQNEFRTHSRSDVIAACDAALSRLVGSQEDDEDTDLSPEPESDPEPVEDDTEPLAAEEGSEVESE